MTTTTRRTVITGAAALPLLPAVALAVPGNATDAAWSAYEAAKAAFEATDRDYDAVEASLPEHLKISAHPDMPPEGRSDEWRKTVDAFNRSRAELGAEVAGEACDQAAGKQNDAEKAVLETSSTTLIDVERKLAVVSGWNGGNDIPAEFVDGILADVRSLMGVAS